MTNIQEHIVIYTRTSSTSSFNENSKERQIQICCDFASKNKYTVSKIFTDLGVSSEVSLNQRIAFQDLIKFSIQNNIKYIIVESLTRLGRTYSILKEFQLIHNALGLNLIPTSNTTFMEIINDDRILTYLSNEMYGEKISLNERLKKAKIINQQKQLDLGFTTLKDSGKVGGRKSILEKFPIFNEIILNNLNKNLFDLQKLLFINGVTTNNKKPISISSIHRNKLYLLSKIDKKKYSSEREITIDKSTTSNIDILELINYFNNKILFNINENMWYQYDVENNIWVELKNNQLEFMIFQRLTTNYKLKNVQKHKILNIIYNLQNTKILNILDWPEYDEFNLIFKDGVYNIKTKEFKNANPNLYLRYSLPFLYKDYKNTDINLFEYTKIYQWLLQTVGNNVDLVFVILCFMYCSIFRITKYQKFLEVVGPGGTGKSTLLKVFEALVGTNNTAVTDLKQLETNKFETATLKNKNLILITDSSRYGGDCSILKAMTGEDMLRYEEKHKQVKNTFKNTGLVIIASNEAIISSDLTSGLRRRRINIGFNIKPTFIETLLNKTKEGWEGLLAEDLIKLLKYVVNLDPILVNKVLSDPKLFIPSLELLELENHRATNNIFTFIEQCLIFDPNSYLSLGNTEKILSIYQIYYLYCENNRYNALSPNRFIDIFMDLVNNTFKWNVLKKRANFGIFFQGLSFISFDKTLKLSFNKVSDIYNILKVEEIEYTNTFKNYENLPVNILSLSKFIQTINEIKEIKKENNKLLIEDSKETSEERYIISKIIEPESRITNKSKIMCELEYIEGSENVPRVEECKELSKETTNNKVIITTDLNFKIIETNYFEGS